MKNKSVYLIEPLMVQYFLIDSICTDYIDNTQKKRIFNELMWVFCVPDDGCAEEYFSVASSPCFSDITDYAAYERLCRKIEFAEASGQFAALSHSDRSVLAQKREALRIKADIFRHNKNLTAGIIEDTLFDAATNGNVEAMSILAYMEYHGIFIGKDRKNAVKRMRVCARWNNLFANLMGITYDTDNAEEYYNALGTILKGASRQEVFGHICEFNSREASYEKHSPAEIIEKAFGMGIIERNVYNRSFAKTAFSQIISYEDKKKLLLGNKRDTMLYLGDLPFDTDNCGVFSFDAERAKKIPLERELEADKILCALHPATSNRPYVYRTALVVCGDEYVENMYINAIKSGFEGNNKTFEIDAGTLSARDFSGTKENFILRGLGKTKNTHTVFLIKHCESLEESEELIKLLDYEYRRSFKLLDPAVSFDLSNVLIVLFASEMNETVKSLSAYCDVIRADGVTGIERSTVIESTFRKRSDDFGICDAQLNDEGKTYLSGFSTEQIILIIDGALKKAAYDNKSVITAETLKTISAQYNFTSVSSEFGYRYSGGAYNEKY